MIHVPASMVTVARSWHWGIAVLIDAGPNASIPDDAEPTPPVTAGESALIVAIRHAQDVDADEGFTHAIAVIRRWEGAMRPSFDDARITFDGVLATPSGALEIGDADEWFRVPTFEPRTRVLVSVATDEDDRSPNAVVFDLFADGAG